MGHVAEPFEHGAVHLPRAVYVGVEASLFEYRHRLHMRGYGSSFSAAALALQASYGMPVSEIRAVKIASAIGLRQMFALQTKRTFFVASSPALSAALDIPGLSTAIDVFEADYILLVELAEGDLEDSDRALARAG